MVFLMVVIIAVAAFAIDIARMHLVRSQLQTAVDAGALAGALQLKQDPSDVEAARLAAVDFVQQNRVGFLVNVPDDAITVEVGNWDFDDLAFANWNNGEPDPNAIRVQATREDEPFLLAGIFGRTTFSIPRQSVVACGDGLLDIMMVLDLTGSMSSDGPHQALRSAAPTFVNVIQGLTTDDRIGVMGFGAVKGDYNPLVAGHHGTVYTATPG